MAEINSSRNNNMSIDWESAKSEPVKTTMYEKVTNALSNHPIMAALVAIASVAYFNRPLYDQGVELVASIVTSTEVQIIERASQTAISILGAMPLYYWLTQ